MSIDLTLKLFFIIWIFEDFFSNGLVIKIMTEEHKYLKVQNRILHPRLKEVLEEMAPPSPFAVPRDSSQPRAGNLLSIHKDGYLTPPLDPVIKAEKLDKPEVRLSLDSFLLRRRRDK